MASPAPHQTEYRPTPSGVAMSIDRLIERIRAEYIEQPGLRLTEAQASRLWRLDEPTCHYALTALTGDAFLQRSADGRYARPSIR